MSLRGASVLVCLGCVCVCACAACLCSIVCLSLCLCVDVASFVVCLSDMAAVI